MGLDPNPYISIYIYIYMKINLNLIKNITQQSGKKQKIISK